MTLRRRLERLEEKQRPEGDRAGLDYRRLSEGELLELVPIAEKVRDGIKLTPAEEDRARALLQKAKGGGLETAP